MQRETETLTKRRGIPVEFVAFLLSGGVAAAVNVGTRALLSSLLPYEVAIVLAYSVGMVVAYSLMRAFVFQSAKSGSHHGQFVRFAIVNVFGLAQTMLVSEIVARWAAPGLGFGKHAETIGHVLGVGTPAVTSFFGHKYFSFKERRAAVATP
jgi:putative flippase GtrA